MTRRIVNADAHKKNLSQMNNEQKELFVKIMGTIEKQENNDKVKPIKMMVSGYGGVGKSFVIGLLADALTLKYTTPTDQAQKPSVLLAAPTGNAAAQINGSTIHSLFEIRADTGREKLLLPLSIEKRDQRRFQFSNVRLIIIDEISMVGNETLLKMDSRLREITGNTSAFGGKNICFFGDLLQLPPVKQAKVFQTLNRVQMKNIFGSGEIITNSWHGIKYHELQQNMRQQYDTKFSNILHNIRIQNIQPEDESELEARVIGDNNDGDYEEALDLFVRKQNEDPRVMALFPLNIECAKFNEEIIEVRKNEGHRTVTIESDDSRSVRRTKSLPTKRTRPWQRSEFQLTNKPNRPTKPTTKDKLPIVVSGLFQKLELFKSCRIMLRKNINVHDGLVNGMCGIIDEFVTIADGTVAALKIRFDHNPGKVFVINRTSASYQLTENDFWTRSQFPIVPAYAVTIHKSQGLTLDNVFISTKNIFTKCQFYVAVSRVRTMEGLHFINFNKDLIAVDIASLIEYNRLRASINLPPFRIPKDIRMPHTNTTAISIVYTSAEHKSKRGIKSTPKRKSTSPLLLSEKPPKRKSHVSSKDTSLQSGAASEASLGLDFDIKIDDYLASRDETSIRSELTCCTNIDRDCFLSCVIAMMGNNHIIRNAILSYDEQNDALITQFKSIIQKTTADCHDIRVSLGPQFRGDSDAQEAMIALVDLFPPSIKQHFSLWRITSKQCNSNCPIINETETQYWLSIINHRQLTSLQTLMIERTKRKTKTELCNRCHAASMRVTTLWRNDGETFYVHIRSIEKFEDWSKWNTFTIFDYEWEIYNCVEFVQEGHYVCYHRHDDNTIWRIDDHIIEEVPDFPEHLKDVTIICFRKTIAQ